MENLDKKNLTIFLAYNVLMFMVFIVISPPSLYSFASNKIAAVGSEFSHDTEGCDYHCQVQNSGLNGRIGEVLFRGNTCDVRYMMELWEDSPTHKEVLDRQYDEAVLLIRRDGEDCHAVMNTLADQNYEQEIKDSTRVGRTGYTNSKSRSCVPRRSDK